VESFENIVGYNKGPKGKMPWIELNGTPMADSGLIIAHFAESGIADLDTGTPSLLCLLSLRETGLSVEEQAISLAFIRMIEEHLYFGTVYRNWVDDDGWATSKNEFFKCVFSSFFSHFFAFLWVFLYVHFSVRARVFLSLFVCVCVVFICSRGVPSLLRGPIGAIARKGVQTQVEKQGLGLHAKEEIYRMVAKDFQVCLLKRYSSHSYFAFCKTSLVLYY